MNVRILFFLFVKRRFSPTKNCIRRMSLSVLYSSANDPQHPASAVLTASPTSANFWSTTGLFPHELALGLSTSKALSKIKLVSTGIHHLVIERQEDANDAKWIKVVDAKVNAKEGGVQREVFNFQKGTPSKALRINILSSHEDFCRIFAVSIED
eukprot:ANDGO_07557.mRNA.1 Intraflagellar transport protein 25